jgi:hypothetical protein
MSTRRHDLIVLDGAIPAMRDYIIQTWWATKLPVQASKGDPDVRRHAGLGAKSNPAGWWGRAWTAVEAYRRGERTADAWMMARFESSFRGLTRVSNRHPYSYAVADPSECPPPQVEFKRAIERWAGGQGRVESVDERRAIEEAGMTESRTWLRSQGFSDEQIKDTSATKPWDFEAERDGRTLYVEAKGCRSPWSRGSSVFVTRNEVLHARKHRDACALVVAASCQLSRDHDGRLTATSRQTVVAFPWCPNDDDLEPIAYKFRPRKLEAVLRPRTARAVPIGHSGRTAKPRRQ